MLRVPIWTFFGDFEDENTYFVNTVEIGYKNIRYKLVVSHTFYPFRIKKLSVKEHRRD